MDLKDTLIAHKQLDFALSSACLMQLTTGEDYLKRHSPKDVHSAITKGLPGSFLTTLEQFAPRAIILHLLDTDVRGYRNLARRQRLPRHLTERTIGFIGLWNEAIDLLGAEHVSEWFQSVLPALDGLTPCECISTHYGRNLLSDTLDAMRSGEFA